MSASAASSVGGVTATVACAVASTAQGHCRPTEALAGVGVWGRMTHRGEKALTAFRPWLVVLLSSRPAATVYRVDCCSSPNSFHASSWRSTTSLLLSLCLRSIIPVVDRALTADARAFDVARLFDVSSSLLHACTEAWSCVLLLALLGVSERALPRVFQCVVLVVLRVPCFLGCTSAGITGCVTSRSGCRSLSVYFRIKSEQGGKRKISQRQTSVLICKATQGSVRVDAVCEEWEKALISHTTFDRG